VFLRVEVDGASWLADVGLGGNSLTSAIRLDDSGATQATPPRAASHRARGRVPLPFK